MELVRLSSSCYQIMKTNPKLLKPMKQRLYSLSWFWCWVKGLISIILIPDIAHEYLVHTTRKGIVELYLKAMLETNLKTYLKESFSAIWNFKVFFLFTYDSWKNQITNIIRMIHSWIYIEEKKKKLIVGLK